MEPEDPFQWNKILSLRLEHPAVQEVQALGSGAGRKCLQLSSSEGYQSWIECRILKGPEYETYN
jgi:hypothetical protein